jgi:hypothetical protein
VRDPATVGQPLAGEQDQPVHREERQGQRRLGQRGAEGDALLEGTHAAGAALVVATHDPQVAGRLPVHWQLRDFGLHRAPGAPSRSRSGR